ncbi:uncharacterized protein LOC142597935 [Dermatophagoides farinae]|uniref:uncharacterized protein LOC142597935 n=1 Tax=Dermatophagoides farinae TaxID=6954 RepID=UPI003F611792
MTKIKIGINGFGRIGRIVLRASLTSNDVEVVHINDPFMDIAYMAYCLKYDSVHGRLNAKIEHKSNGLLINDKFIEVTAFRSPSEITWGKSDVNVVCECTGVFTITEKAQEHLKGGAKKVIISAPAKDDTPMYVYGVNHKEYKSSQKVISNASCTTNCLAPIMHYVNKEYGVIEGLMTTVHATTATQQPVDAVVKGGKNWRDGRSALANIIPSSTGAAKAVGKVIPELNGKLTGIAFRVPVGDVSVVDVVVRTKKKMTLEDFGNLMKKAANEYPNVIDFTSEEVVSQDFVGDTHSTIIDIKSCIQLNDNFVKIVSWYDNETGYSNRLLDMARYIAIN